MTHEVVPPVVVAVAASAGGTNALAALVSKLPPGLRAAVLVVSHTATSGRRRLATVLSACGPLPACYPKDRQTLAEGQIFVAPPGSHLTVQRGRVRLQSGPAEHFLRPAADVLFRSAARSYRSRAIGVVLSGHGRDGAAGVVAIRRAGGVVLVQDPGDALFASMPLSAISAVTPDACAPVSALAGVLERFVRERAAAVGAPGLPPSRSRSGRVPGRLRVLVAEDDYLIAAEIVGMVRALGGDVVGPAPDLATARLILERASGTVDCAVLDVDLRGTPVYPLAAALREGGVPIVFATGYTRPVLPEAWASAPSIEKPYDVGRLEEALGLALSGPRPSPTAAGGTAPAVSSSAERIKNARNLVMRSRALHGPAPAASVERSREFVTRTREIIATSARRRDASQRALRAWPGPKPREDEGGGGKDE